MKYFQFTQNTRDQCKTIVSQRKWPGCKPGVWYTLMALGQRVSRSWKSWQQLSPIWLGPSLYSQWLSLGTVRHLEPWTGRRGGGVFDLQAWRHSIVDELFLLVSDKTEQCHVILWNVIGALLYESVSDINNNADILEYRMWWRREAGAIRKDFSHRHTPDYLPWAPESAVRLVNRINLSLIQCKNYCQNDRKARSMLLQRYQAPAAYCLYQCTCVRLIIHT